MKTIFIVVSSKLYSFTSYSFMACVRNLDLRVRSVLKKRALECQNPQEPIVLKNSNSVGARLMSQSFKDLAPAVPVLTIFLLFMSSMNA